MNGHTEPTRAVIACRDSLHETPTDRSGACLANAICTTAITAPDRIALVLQAGTPDRFAVTYGTLARQVLDFEERLTTTKYPGVVTIDARIDSLVITTAACGRIQLPLAIVPQDSARLADRLLDWPRLGDPLLFNSMSLSRRKTSTTLPHTDDVYVATSGTTGPPKLVGSRWTKVTAAIRHSCNWRQRSWALVYDTSRWAGIQVWLQALLTGGCIVVPASRDPDVLAKALITEAVSILPTTPTLIRRLLFFADPDVLERARLDQITLGGEPADSTLLTRLKNKFPTARITQVYATTELGEVFRVTDGVAGFPESWLEQQLPSGAWLFVGTDNQLIVRPTPGALHFGTGDIVTREAGRMLFAGRTDNVFLVGGAKVHPEQVEAIIRRVPGVADIRVYSRKNGVTGHTVAGEMVLTTPLPEGASPDSVRSAVLAACRNNLSAHSVPRLLDIAERIGSADTVKVRRW